MGSNKCPTQRSQYDRTANNLGASHLEILGDRVQDLGHQRLWEANGCIGYGPLIPEQRASVSATFSAAYRAIALRRNGTPQDIAGILARHRIPQTTMLMGPGGAGKSNGIFVLAEELQKGGCGCVVIAAYTGVAAAQILGPQF